MQKIRFTPLPFPIPSGQLLRGENVFPRFPLRVTNMKAKYSTLNGAHAPRSLDPGPDHPGSTEGL